MGDTNTTLPIDRQTINQTRLQASLTRSDLEALLRRAVIESAGIAAEDQACATSEVTYTMGTNAATPDVLYIQAVQVLVTIDHAAAAAAAEATAAPTAETA